MHGTYLCNRIFRCQDSKRKAAAGISYHCRQKAKKIKVTGRSQENSRGIQKRPEPFVSRRNSTQVRNDGHVHVQL